MRNLILKISTWVSIICFLIGGVGILILYKSKNKPPEAMQINAIANPGDKLVYATISGGRLDLADAREAILPAKKVNAEKRSDYYIPVLNDKGDSVVYILKTGLTPTLLEPVQKAHFSGFLQSKSKLPQEILDACNTKYAGTDFFYLDSSRRPKTRIQKMIGMNIFFLLAISALVVRILFRRKKRKAPKKTA